MTWRGIYLGRQEMGPDRDLQEHKNELRHIDNANREMDKNKPGSERYERARRMRNRAVSWHKRKAEQRDE